MVTKSNEKYRLSRLADRNLAPHVLESLGLYSLGSKPTPPTQVYLSLFPVTSWIGADTRRFCVDEAKNSLSAARESRCSKKAVARANAQLLRILLTDPSDPIVSCSAAVFLLVEMSTKSNSFFYYVDDVIK